MGVPFHNCASAEGGGGCQSAHADQRDLLNFIKRMRQWPKEVRLVHGDDDARQAMKAEMENMAARRGHEIEVILAGSSA
ncbi:MBL fold metallo-hydrolase RNA specificity domain-containing protein [Vreelandella rituensis]|uniref:Zn-dependent metallo-hydrolase RNA specificity domain-containing protein n=1 Tax=Vreelandella rituensis TaxID=2282306 RepID=A0A368U552_9GAMM|nr:MBL fold metallo-hydrolase RNA specificity domain-containing protein [Halomonas rituensis]RCV92270.1 hypothetical protein DU506_08360 [Halomonas rituensis]